MAKLYFRYGAMGCGKTAALLQVAYNYVEKGLKVIVAKPTIDTKGNNYVTSRIGLEREVDVMVDKAEDIFSMLSEDDLTAQAFIVDEVQFLTAGQIDELYLLTKQYDIPVLCYGLRCDFQMQPFPGSARLLQIADDIEEIKTICSCGQKATQNMRLVDGVPVFEGEQVVIDDHTKVEYTGVCGACYLKNKNKIKIR